MYELLATGTPVVALEVADNQAESLSVLNSKRLIQMAGRVGEKELFERITKHVKELLKNNSKRQALGRGGRNLGIGAGALKVAKILHEMRVNA